VLVGELDFSNSVGSSVIRFSPSSIPTLPSIGLSESERALVANLQQRAQHDLVEMMCANSFYMGEKVISNLNIAIPDDLAARLKALVGWARIAVDPYVERLSPEGFRLPGGTDVDERLALIASANGLDAKFPMAATDALSMSRSYWVAGTREGSDMPVITAESPLNVAVQWDLTGTFAKAALQTFMQDGQKRAMILTPEQDVQIAEDEHGVWQVVSRDVHGFGRVMVHRMAANARTNQLDGYSNITPELQSIITNACRRLMGLEIASELYSVPRLWLLGASLSDFQNANGDMRKAIDAYMSMINVLERDDNGEAPTLQQTTVYDPSTFTKVVEMYASQAAGILAAVPQDLGLYTNGNPTSSESWDSMETRRNRRAVKFSREFGVPLVGVHQDAIRLQNNGVLPREFERIAVDWAPIMPGMSADEISKLTAAQVLPPRSDVTLKHAGFSAVERSQIEQDWREQDQRDALTAVRDAALSLRAPAAPTAAPVAAVTADDGEG
jgi:hypothetical protein